MVRGLHSSRLLFMLLLLASVTLSPGPAHAQTTLPVSNPGTSQDPNPDSGSGAVIYSINGVGRPTIALPGPWQFRTGDDTAWANPDFDDHAWERLSADRPWGEQQHPSYDGFAWYRLHIRTQSALGAPSTYALLMPQTDDAYELYWNGVQLGKSGKFPPFPVWVWPSVPPVIYDLGSATEGVLAVRVWKASPMSEDSGLTGGFETPPLIGTPEALSAARAALDYQWLRSHQLTLAEALLYGMTGVLSLLGWLRNRSQWPLFWMTGFALSPLIRLLLFGLRYPWPVPLTNALGEPVSSIRDISLWFLLLWLLHLHSNRKLVRLTRICAIVSLIFTVLDGIPSIFAWNFPALPLIQIADAVFTAVYFLTAALPLVLVACAVTQRRRLDPSRWMVAIAAFLSGMLQVVERIAPQGVRFTHWTLADKLAALLFTLNGNPVTLNALTGPMLLLAILYALYRNAAENRRRQNVLEQEFKSAQELQRVLIPQALPQAPGYSLSSAYLPALEVGGDFFQIVPQPDGLTLVILGDVSGKGLKAAMAVALIVGLIRALADKPDKPAATDIPLGPAQLLSELNSRLHGRLRGGLTTCIALLVDPQGGCTLASAGHPAPYLNQQEVEIPGSFPLGVVPSVTYEETSLQMSVGDQMAIYSDGLPEARGPRGELFGFDRLQPLFASRLTAAQATEAAVRFGQDDDITVVILTRVVIGEEFTSLQTAPKSANENS